MTLVEVMIGSVVVTVTLLALLGASLMAYKINHKARLRDNGRAVLRTYVDQFQRLGYANEDKVIRMIFTPTTGPTGLGLEWGSLSNKTNYPGAPTECKVDIGPPGLTQWAIVTREVSYVDVGTGDESSTRVADAAGFMLKATFKITYTLNGAQDAPVVQSMSTLKLVD